MREPCLEGAGDTAREMGGRVGGRGDTARKFDGPLDAGAGNADSRLSVDDRFIDEKGVFSFLRLPLGDAPPPAFSLSRAAAAGLGDPAPA
jgi:hypothetical protein